MKKSLIALAVLGTTAGIAHAQSNVTIYGIIDIGLAKSGVNADRVFGSNGPGTPTATSNPSAISDNLRMTEKVNSRIGFSGAEDLGGGLKATFQLEQRFKPNDGSQATATLFEGASNVGLAGSFGAVRFGRVNNILNETIRTFDPFNEFGVSAHLVTSVAATRQSNTIRYDSPSFNGVGASATYQLQGPDTVAGNNAGYLALAKYNNGPLALAAAYEKKADSYESTQASLAGAYAFGTAKVSVIYDDATLKSTAADVDQKNWLIGLSYRIGAGTINSSYQHLKWEQASLEKTDKRYSLGYSHDLSKRTALYADFSHTTGDRVSETNAGDDSYNAINVGITHKF